MAALLVAATAWGERAVARAYDARLLARGAEAVPPAAARDADPEALLGRIDIPRLGLSAPVREGVTASTLDVAVGHVPGSARPGEPGNAALAGHRDTDFRPLRGIRAGDEIRFLGKSGETRYRVLWTRVVTPDRVDVVRPESAGDSLTLVTCYPFGFVGRAPKRFVVRASRI